MTFWECSVLADYETGGAIGCEADAAPVIESCRVSYCYGAGIAAHGRSRPLVESCTVNGSSCGVAMSGTADVTLNFCRIEDSGGGRGITSWASGARLRLVGCVMTDNAGGGLRAWLTDVTIQNSTIAGNRLPSGDVGSGVWVEHGSLLLDRSIVSGNCSDPGVNDYEVALVDAHALIRCSAVDSLRVRLMNGSTVEYEDGLVPYDPMFCDPGGGCYEFEPGNDWHLDGASPCLPQNSPCGELIGALGEGCGSVPVGACCFADHSCAVLQQDDCEQGQGVYKGDGTGCEPNPCEPTAVAPSTWGRVRASFR